MGTIPPSANMTVLKVIDSRENNIQGISKGLGNLVNL